MASTADLVYKNIRWRIESIDPTNARPRCPFKWLDPEIVDPEDSPLVRAFTVTWDGEDLPDPDVSVADVTERDSNHAFTVEVQYPNEYPLHLRTELILQDRHDLIKALRDDRQFFGYSAANPSDDIGLWSRRVVRAELDDEFEDTTTLRLEVACTILESE